MSFLANQLFNITNTVSFLLPQLLHTTPAGSWQDSTEFWGSGLLRLVFPFVILIPYFRLNNHGWFKPLTARQILQTCCAGNKRILQPHNVMRFCHLFIIFLLKMAVNCRFLCSFALAIRKECKDILLNRLSIHHHEKRANTYYWDCPNKAQISPYICVACGEPRVVWRMSAPLSLKKYSQKL